MRTTLSRRLARTATAGAALLMIAGAGAATAAPAAAAEKNGVLEAGELGLYYNSNFGGGIFDLVSSDPNFANDRFPTSPSVSPDNNTASYDNRDVYAWQLCTDANYTGTCGRLLPGARGNFSDVYKNKVTSARWVA
ncbi:peptidase inhibitor family I36 protein [Streptomyces sp. NPDC000594]|uniref:peptidase inhibitor family I36 protein n=1 Tax=Streptomyces sp. NPDC000594 TaxID=3154261 RepID=UPI00331727C7